MANLKNFKVNQGLEVNGVITATTISATSIDATLTGAALDSPTFTGTVTMPSLNVGQGGFSAPNFGDVTSDEIQQLDGVTSNIQQQLNTKASITYVDNAVANAGGGGSVDLTPYATKLNPQFNINSDMSIPIDKIVIYFSQGGTPPGMGSLTFKDIDNVDTRLYSLPYGAFVKFPSNYSENGVVKPWAGATFTLAGVASEGGDEKGYGLHYIDNPFPGLEFGIRNPDPGQYLTISYESSSTISAKELSHLDGVTANIQNQIDGKVSAINLDLHESKTLNIHGIADTTKLATTTYVDNAVANSGGGGSVDLTPYATKINPTFSVNDMISISVPLSNAQFYFSTNSTRPIIGNVKITNPDAIDSRLKSLPHETLLTFPAGFTESGSLSPLAGKTVKLMGIQGFNDDGQWTFREYTIQYVGEEPSGINYGVTLVTNPSQSITVSYVGYSDITPTELVYLDGITSNIQQQLDTKANTYKPKFSVPGSLELYVPNLIWVGSAGNAGKHNVTYTHPFSGDFRSQIGIGIENSSNILLFGINGNSIPQGGYIYRNADSGPNDYVIGFGFIENAISGTLFQSLFSGLNRIEITTGSSEYSVDISSYELSHLNNVHTNIQSQLDLKLEYQHLDTNLLYSSYLNSKLGEKASTTQLSNHESDTTNIHGIANTADLATKTDPEFMVSEIIAGFSRDQDWSSIAVSQDYYTWDNKRVAVTFYDHSLLMSQTFANNALAGYSINATSGLPGLPAKKYDIIQSHGVNEGPTDSDRYNYVWLLIELEGENFPYGGLQNNDATSFQIISTKNISSIEISYLDGTTSNIQQQLDNKATKVNPVFEWNLAGYKAFTGDVARTYFAPASISYKSFENKYYLQMTSDDPIFNWVTISGSPSGANGDFYINYIGNNKYDLTVAIGNGFRVDELLGYTPLPADYEISFKLINSYLTRASLTRLMNITEPVQDQLDQLKSAYNQWQIYSPEWSSDGSQPSLGDGSLKGSYRVVGKTVHFKVKLTLGSTTSFGSGTWMFTLPLEARDSNYHFAGAALNDGIGWYQATGVGDYIGSKEKFAILVATPTGTSNSVTSAHPFTWGQSDTLSVSGTYEML